MVILCLEQLDHWIVMLMDLQQQFPAEWEWTWLESHSSSLFMKNSLRIFDWLKSSMWSFFFFNSQHQLFGFWTFWSSMSKFVLSLLIVLARKLWIIQRFLLFLWWKDINYNLQYFIGWETALWITKRRKKQINKEPVSHYWINLYAESATMGEVSRVRGSLDFP